MEVEKYDRKERDGSSKARVEDSQAISKKIKQTITTKSTVQTEDQNEAETASTADWGCTGIKLHVSSHGQGRFWNCAVDLDFGPANTQQWCVLVSGLFWPVKPHKAGRFMVLHVLLWRGVG
jgi:hypothetical protein